VVTAPGYARTETRAWRGTGKYPAGARDIKITVPVEARIEGIVVDKATRKPVPGVRLAVSGMGVGYFVRGMGMSRDDGRFSITSLSPGNLTVTLMKPKGGLCEVTVTDARNNEPVVDAHVNMRGQEMQQRAGGMTDAKGVARFRLFSGTYEYIGVGQRGYIRWSKSEPITIKEGVTQRLSVELNPFPVVRVRGVVRDQKGEIVPGTTVSGFPSIEREGISDKDGKFEVSHSPVDQIGDWRESALVFRHTQRNLAALVKLEEGSERVEVAMQPAVTLTGKVIDPEGKPIPNADVRAVIYVGNIGGSFARGVADAEGRYELNTLPRIQKYQVSVEGDGFGRDDVPVWVWKDEPDRIKVGPIVLRPANLSVSGTVVNSEGQPVPNIPVSVQGRHRSGQPYIPSVSTSDAGEFTIDGLCEGMISVQAYFSRDNLGNTWARAGEKNVRIVLGQDSISPPMDEAAPKEANRKALQKLQSTKVSPRFKETPFMDAIQFLRDVTGLEIAISYRAMHEARVTLGTPVSLELSNVSAEEALKKILKYLDGDPPMGYVIRGGSVMVSTGKSRSPATRPTTTRPRSPHTQPVKVSE
jgi:hypothetical protein